MTKSSIKKYSILGLVLLVASAVTAAILPSKKDSDPRLNGGRLTASSLGADTLTCIPEGNECTATASDTTTPNGSAHLTTGIEGGDGLNTTGDGIN